MKILPKQPIENTRAYALRVIKENIVTLELPPGSSISENELASLLNVSRTPVREALIELSKMGLVEILPQRGSYVSKIDYSVIEDSQFIRVAVETAILKLVCKGISSDYIELFDENIKEQRECVEQEDSIRFMELDNAFHKLLFYSVRKEQVYEFINPQMVHFNRLRALTLKSIKYQKNFEDHENILYAIKRNDSELAEMLMTKHLSRHILDKDELIKKYTEYFV